METASTHRQRLLFTATVFLAALAHLAWEHFNGGIRTHHFLGDARYPALYNGWSALILPALAWVSSRRIAKYGVRRSVAIGFAAGLLYGVALSIAFSVDAKDSTSVLFFAIFAISLLLPIYRAECVLGFVFAMTFVFGPFIPLFFSAIFAAISALAHRLLYPFVGQLLRSTSQANSKR
jgi:hypothetical protein